MKTKFYPFVTTILFVPILYCSPLLSKHTLKFKAANICRSLYSDKVPIIDSSEDLIHQIEKANLNRLMDPRRVYYRYENYFKSLPTELRSSISTYKGMEYVDINRLLRQGDLEVPAERKDYLLGLISHIDQAIDQGPKVPRGVVLFRGISSVNHAMGQAQVGDVINDKAFSSTSLAVDVAMRFTNSQVFQDKTPEALLQIIYINKENIRGLYIESESSSNFEKEFLLDKNTQFRVLKKQIIWLDNRYPSFLPPVIPPSEIGLLPGLPPGGDIIPISDPGVLNDMTLLPGEKVPKQLELFPDLTIDFPGGPVFPPPTFNVTPAKMTKLIIQHVVAIQER